MRLLAIGAFLAFAATAHAAMPDIVSGWQVLAQKEMAKTLKDPRSAKYKDVHAYALTAKEGKKVYIFCGKVNAKNGFGGYMGYERFIATPAFVILESQMKHGAKTLHMFCNPKNDVGRVAF